MSQPWHSQRKKNWQWRVIIWSSLFLIFGKDLGHFAYHALALDTAYKTTSTLAQKTGFAITKNEATDTFNSKSGTLLMSQLIMDVKNDTLNDYTVETKTSSAHVNYLGHIFQAGTTKRFVIRPDVNAISKQIGTGDILFFSAPIFGKTTCQEVHTLNFNLNYANQVKQPMVINLSSITSNMKCRDQ